MTEQKALQPLADGLWTCHCKVRPGPGMEMETRMTVLRLDDGALWLHSPTALDDRTAAEIDELGQVRHLVAPNLFHHLFLIGAAERWKSAEIWAPPGLAGKRPKLRVTNWLSELESCPSWPDEMEAHAIDGMPRVQEFVFFHRPSSTLIVTDLIFNRPVAHSALTGIFFRLAGTYDRLSVSRLFRSVIKDRAAFSRSCRKVLELPAKRLVMAHGEVIEREGADRLQEALGPVIA